MGAKTSPSGDPRTDHIELMHQLSTRKNIPIARTYNRSFVGFAARLSEEEAKSIAQTPGVMSVYPDRVIPLHTTHSWDFLRSQCTGGLTIDNSVNSGTFSKSNRSTPTQDTIIGVIDTGIWPEHPSFNDAHMSAITRRWSGTCMADENSTPFPCNKKVIGARYYADEQGFITTTRDKNGHGSQTASIAAGIPVHGASYYGLAAGTAVGGSPYSRIAAYCVCNGQGYCLSSAVLQAFDDAIADGVDVISFSLGHKFDGLLDDTASIGSFHAAEKGITVVNGAGNGGPSAKTVQNPAPWMINVAATTIDRDFEATIVLGNNKKIKAGGINFSHLNKFTVYPLIEGHSARSNPRDLANSSNCIPGSLDVDKAKGNIILCEDQGDFHLLLKKIYSLNKQGVIGMIVINNDISNGPTDYGTFAVAGVTEFDGNKIRSYIKKQRNPLATILPTKMIMNYKPAPVVVHFSSRGPINGIKNLIKPDVSAPGVSIVGAWVPYGKNRTVLFNIDWGTSISCPHVSGVAATVKFWHPTWSPSAIRSAIMTTAIHTNNINAPITTDYGSIATPYDMGAGEISLLGPLSPGLVYETETIDYLHFMCNMGYNTSLIKTIASHNFDCPHNSSPDLISDMNYPSIAVSGLKSNERTVKRTLTNVGEPNSTYAVKVEALVGLQVRVVPNKLQFTEFCNKLSFHVTFKFATTPSEYSPGSITWFNQKHNVRIPFVASNE